MRIIAQLQLQRLGRVHGAPHLRKANEEELIGAVVEAGQEGRVQLARLTVQPAAKGAEGGLDAAVVR